MPKQVPDVPSGATPLGPYSTVTEAAGCCPVDLSVVSRHLATLKEAGILQADLNGCP